MDSRSFKDDSDWPPYKQWFVPYDELPSTLWGPHGDVPGFLVGVAGEEETVRHYFGGADILGDTPRCWCGVRMQAGLRLDLTDPLVMDILNVKGGWRTLLLPYCTECGSKVFLNIFRLTNMKGELELKKTYYLGVPQRLVERRIEGLAYEDWPLIPLRLRPLKVGERLTSESIFNQCPCPRLQIGGFPIHVQEVKHLKNPVGGARMQFVACISDISDLYDHCDKLGGVGISDGGLYFFIDWDEGILASIYQST